MKTDQTAATERIGQSLSRAAFYSASYVTASLKSGEIMHPWENAQIAAGPTRLFCGYAAGTHFLRLRRPKKRALTPSKKSVIDDRTV
jgi:hypothetical protein